MDEPLGCTVGNALEVAEAVETLRGGGPDDLKKLTLDLAAQVSSAPRATLEKWLADGTAWEKFVALTEAQGGDSGALEKIADIHRAPIVFDLRAKQSGRITKMDAGMIGNACVQLGAGRQKTGDAVDYAVGCSAISKAGASVEKGGTLLRIHARSDASLQAVLPIFETAAAVL